jgi:transcriptional regulator GlxA family with amidase domain
VHSVGIVLYNGVDEFEVAAPLDILGSCRKMDASHGHWTEHPAFSVTTVAESLGAMETSHGFSVTARTVFGQVGDLDVIIVPGGPGARLQRYPMALIDWLVYQRPRTKTLVSLSTGAFILARSGMLSHQRLTTYPAFVADIRRIEPTCSIAVRQRIVSDQGGGLISTAGIAQSVDAALGLIEKFEGIRSAEIAAKRIGWPVNIDDIVPIYST